MYCKALSSSIYNRFSTFYNNSSFVKHNTKGTCIYIVLVTVKCTMGTQCELYFKLHIL